MPGDGQLVEVGGGGFVERLECEIIDLSGAERTMDHVSAGSDVADASGWWLANADAVLMEEAAQAEQLAMCGGELRLEVADLTSREIS